NVIDPRAGVREVLGRIAASKFVAASSLHGIVVAESFGIPARLVASQVEPPFKYQDYYLGTGRSDVAVASSLDEAIALGGASLPAWSPDELLRAFPYDLWV
ncbi:MAG: polysaccharide pyruvyl transferase family protein, partial [Actinobacteria bacterium]|nr:polysaccharide pyruvyl transferase family protein [Actinomycetota bacterium]